MHPAKLAKIRKENGRQWREKIDKEMAGGGLHPAPYPDLVEFYRAENSRPREESPYGTLARFVGLWPVGFALAAGELYGHSQLMRYDTKDVKEAIWQLVAEWVLENLPGKMFKVAGRASVLSSLELSLSAPSVGAEKGPSTSPGETDATASGAALGAAAKGEGEVPPVGLKSQG
jgi:hypothetical protein